MKEPKYKNWKYKNTTLLVISFIVLLIFADMPVVKNTINSISSLGNLGVFFTGIFFVSIFTVAPATVILFSLAQKFSPASVALFAGLGAVVGDYLIFRFLKDRVFSELQPLFKGLGGSYLKKFFHTPYFAWILPILGAAIIASPLPDEIGISMMGLSKVKNWQFALISWVLNTAGIFIILSVVQVVKSQ